MCKKQLEKDEFVAKRDGLKIKTIQDDMKDLSVFNDETFDFIMQFAGAYVDTVPCVERSISCIEKRFMPAKTILNINLQLIFKDKQ